MKKLGLIVMPLMAISFLASCGSDNRKDYIVFFDTNGGSPEVERQIVKENDYAKDPQIDVKRDGVSLSYWSLQDEGEDSPSEFVFKDNKITSDITLHAIYPNDTTNPLAITCTKGPMSLCLYFISDFIESTSLNIKWSTNKIEWTNIDITLEGPFDFEKIVDLNTNETVYLAGDNPNGFSYLGRNISISNNFEDENSEFEVSGNPLSVVDSANYASITEMPPYCFHSLFACSNITSAKNLSLACSKLSLSCYSSMFSFCKKLVEAPELPATTLADSCYSSMFFECSALINAPELPATSFNEDCVGCYECMFRGCVSLSQVKVGFGEGDIWPAFGVKSFTEKWLDEVSYLGTFEWKGSDNPTTFTRGRNTIPTGWTIKPY